MIYRGIKPRSEAEKFPQKQHAYTETVRGQEVDYYHVWGNEETVYNPFNREEPSADIIREYDIYRNPKADFQLYDPYATED